MDKREKMSTTDLKHLFTPGTGAVPPYLAGRKQEQEYFRDCVEVLKGRNSVSRDLILYGPRGNGKTALLRYLQTKTRQKEGDRLDILWVTPDEMATETEFAHLLSGPKKLKDRFKKLTGSVGAWVASAGIEMDLSGSLSITEYQIREKCKRKPFILIIDEAHRLKPSMAESLLNSSQTVRSDGCPFLLVLAGTPNLGAALSEANASFWDRNELVPLGRLSPDEAGQAISVPLQEAGITFAPGVLENIVEQTDCYPFFTQLWGDCLARKLDETKEVEITTETVKAVEEAVIRKRNAMYQVRFNELDRMELLSVAESVAEAFTRLGEPTLHGSELDQAIERGLAGDEPITDGGVMEKVEQLSHLGYIWPAGEYDYEPGIPSLMAFVQGYSLSQTRGKKAEPDQQKRDNEHH